MQLSSKMISASIVATMVLLLSGAAVVRSAVPVATATLTGLQVMERGQGGHSFSVREWTESWPGVPRVFVVSDNWLPVEPYWSVDITGGLRTLTGTRKDGTVVEYWMLIVAPEDVLVYCDRWTGEPCRTSPMTGMDITRVIKRPLTDFPVTAPIPAELPAPPNTPGPPQGLQAATPQYRGVQAQSTAVSTPATADDSWVYLTGQVVTYVGHYYSYDISAPGMIDVYNIQGIDRTPGVRVWKPTTNDQNPWQSGAVVDVMAKLATVDGQRMLGVWESNGYNAMDLSISTRSIEPKMLCDSLSPLPNVDPVGMNNRDLGGVTLLNNPGVTDGVGLYNIGGYTTVWGKVLEVGTYPFDQTFSSVNYLRIDDGAYVPSGNPSFLTEGFGTHGVIVFGTNTWGGPNVAAVGDIVSVTGVSSVWKPGTSADRYRAIWTAKDAVNQTAPPILVVSRTVNSRGTISGIVKLYDMPEELTEATVNVFCTGGRTQTLTITRDDQDSSGSQTYEFTGLPIDVDVVTTQGGFQNTYTELPKYIVSAKCDGYKTRTYTNVTPWTGTPQSRNIYVPRRRKLYVMTNNSTIDSCSGTVITATVRKADHSPDEGVTVRFRTDKGSFSASGTPVFETIGAATNNEGIVAVTLYAVDGETGSAKVEATDDSAPLDGDLDDDPYSYDWVQLHDVYGTPGYVTIGEPSHSLDLATDPTTISVCGGTSEVTATVKLCETPVGDGVVVSFTTDRGVFDETEDVAATATTDIYGVATVHLKASTDGAGVANITANATVHQVPLSASTPALVTIGTDALALTASSVIAATGQSVSITAHVEGPTGSNVVGRTVNFEQTGGDAPSSGSDTTDGTGNAHWSVTRSTPGKVTVMVYEDMSCSLRVSKTIVVWFYDTAPDDWPMFMHDGQHTGMSNTYDISGETLAREWVVDLPTATTVRTTGVWNVTIGQQTVYHQNPAGGLTFIFGHPYIDSSPVVVGNKVVVGTWTSGDYLTATGSVKAFDAANSGATLWTATGSPTMGGVASTPCISDGRVYVGTTNGYLYCLNLSNGNQIWARQTTDRIENSGSSKIISSPVVHNGVVYITNEASKVYAFTADGNGTLVAGYPIVLPIDTLGHGDGGNGVTTVAQQNICGASSPAVAVVGENAYLLVGCDDGYVYRITLSDKNITQLYMGGCVESSPSVSGNYAYVGVSIYGGEDLQRVIIEDSITGDLAYSGSWELGEESRATASLAYDYAYNGVDTGYIFYRVHDPASDPVREGLPQFTATGGDTNYFVGSAAHTTGGIVYTGNDNGRFYALDAADLHSLVDQANVHGYYDTLIQNGGFICSSPAIGYNVDISHNRWVFVTTRADGGKLYAFETGRPSY